MRYKNVSRKPQTGFSLIEVSIVLVIVGLLLGGMMLPLSTQIERSQRNDTRKTLDEALDAIYGYALANGRLPCPDSNRDGVEDRQGNRCQSAYGFLPWATLATARQDAWGQPLLYRVTPGFADKLDGTGCTTPKANVSFSLCSKGDLRIIDGVGGRVVALDVPAVLLSRGKAWSRLTADERENVNHDKVFVDRRYSNVEGKEYDDIVRWVVPAVLKNKMAEAGLLP